MDKGYFSGAEILACHGAGITATVPRPETSGNRGKGMFVKADFRYEPDRDVYRCPAGKELIYRYTREEGGLKVRRYWINECQHCPLQPRCTSGKERRITRWEHEDLVDEMRERLSRDPDPMTLRRCTVEHPFGTIKSWMGATHFQMRRLKNVRMEMAHHVLTLQHQADGGPDRHPKTDPGDPRLRSGGRQGTPDRKAADPACQSH